MNKRKADARTKNENKVDVNCRTRRQSTTPRQEEKGCLLLEAGSQLGIASQQLSSYVSLSGPENWPVPLDVMIT